MLQLNFKFRLILLTTVAVALAVALSSTLVHRKWTSALEKRLAAELLAIVNSAASMIDGDLHQMIYAREDHSIAGLEEFEIIRQQLQNVKEMNRLSGPGSPIYTMRPSANYERRGWLEFVVMTDPDGSGSYFVGNRYRAEPHNRAALQGIGMASEVYADDHGSWISASAPIRDGEGKVVAIVQADRAIEFLAAQARDEALSMVRFGGLAILLGGLLAAVVARGLTRPIRDLARAAEAVGANDLSHRLDVARSDELGELARVFNDMVNQLEAQGREMEEARRNAEDETRVKSEFIAVIAERAQEYAARIQELGDQLGELTSTPEQIKLCDQIRHESKSLFSAVRQPVADVLSACEFDSDPRRDEKLTLDETPTRSAVGEISRRREMEPAPGEAHLLTVLFAEDNQGLRQAAMQLLTELGCQVDWAEDGEEAIARVSARDYDVIFMDCQMPRMDGFEAVRRIRDREKSRTPVIGLVPDTGSARRERCIGSGMDDILVKPITRGALRACLAQLDVG